MTSTCSGCFPVYQHNQSAHCDEGGCLFCPFVDYDPFIDHNNSDNSQGNFDDIVMDLKKLFDEVSSEETSSNLEFPANVFDIDNTECSICFDVIDKQKNNCTTECGHSFCFKCIATSIAYKNYTCPYCRTNIVEIKEKAEDYEEIPYYDENDENDEDYDENENAEEDYDEEYDEEEDDDETKTLCGIEEIVDRLEKNNITKNDLVSLLIRRFSGNYNKKDDKYTEEYIMELNLKFNGIVYEANLETQEQELFAAEDKY
jgi:hypothetical protein